MITLIKNARLFSPMEEGIKDILIVNGKIEKVDDRIELSGIEYDMIDACGRIVTPGFIDKHVHITGGGGEFGFGSFATEVTAEELLGVGTTTVLGLLGTDGVVKEVTTLYAKTKNLDTRLTAYMLSGSYSFPPKTITGSIDGDIIFIDKVIGCKLALSDDRGSFPTEQELKRLLSQIWRGGMTSGKAGILHIHMGVLPSGIDLILKIARETPRLMPHISLTHCARQESLFKQCMEYAKMGGNLDITTGGSKFTEPYNALSIALEAGVPLERITFSSDGRGGIRHIDPVTGEETYGTGSVDSNYEEFKNVISNKVLTMTDALRLLTVNPARELALKSKGSIAKGYDADMIFFEDDLSINKVISKGR
ncbi:MAG: beta-aspartyl-peptidase [Bacteroidales bacterium]|nr:beta-aspartyl-peptidase [Bacteroidales bacterium]MDD4671192.1 beta-aspartyl-peptidase [Bacteroidales bacterium]